MPIIIERKCPWCGNVTTIAVDNAKYDRWQSGEHIQNVFPDLTSMERETLMSGVCSDKCWDEMWPGDE
jgi:hypothetical protein